MTQSSDPRICIIGVGMSGLLMAIKLLTEGIDNIVIYEKASLVAATGPLLACSQVLISRSVYLGLCI